MVKCSCSADMIEAISDINVYIDTQEKDKITTDFIRLDAALKLADIAATGGHAKIIISDGEIKISGEVCIQRGKKLRVGDSFEYNHIIYDVM